MLRGGSGHGTTLWKSTWAVRPDLAARAESLRFAVRAFVPLLTGSVVPGL